MQLSTQFSWLTSVSFWCLFLIAVANFLGTQGIIQNDIVTGIDTILGAIVGVRLKNQVTGTTTVPPTSQNG